MFVRGKQNLFICCKIYIVLLISTVYVDSGLTDVPNTFVNLTIKIFMPISTDLKISKKVGFQIRLFDDIWIGLEIIYTKKTKFLLFYPNFFTPKFLLFYTYFLKEKFCFFYTKF